MAISPFAREREAALGDLSTASAEAVACSIEIAARL